MLSGPPGFMIIGTHILGCFLLLCTCKPKTIIGISLRQVFRLLLTLFELRTHIQIISNWTASSEFGTYRLCESEGSGKPAHLCSLARTFAARSYKQRVKRNLQTESQISGPSEWLGMRSYNLSWRNARRHKFAWRGPNWYTVIKN